MQEESGRPRVVDIGTCDVCGELVEIDVGSLGAVEDVMETARRTFEGHVRSHSSAELVHSQVRRAVRDLPSRARSEALKPLFERLLDELGDDERRGVYRLDEALGSPSLYRLWHDANSCTAARCPHAPE